jgi:flagellar assembly protein FliH
MWSEGHGANGGHVAAVAEPFRYRQVPSPANGNSETQGGEWYEGAVEDPAAQLKAAERESLQKGRAEGEASAKAAAQAEIAALREAVRQAVEKFKEERSNYFARIESEVVQLALAIARKILHREAQMDPLLLAGMVHVALEKLDAGTRIRMRTHPNDIRLWSEYFSQQQALATQIDLVGDATLRRGECVLETESGRTQMSLEGQLKEIEQGFLDLLEHRPAVS